MEFLENDLINELELLIKDESQDQNADTTGDFTSSDGTNQQKKR